MKIKLLFCLISVFGWLSNHTSGNLKLFFIIKVASTEERVCNAIKREFINLSCRLNTLSCKKLQNLVVLLKKFDPDGRLFLPIFPSLVYYEDMQKVLYFLEEYTFFNDATIIRCNFKKILDNCPESMLKQFIVLMTSRIDKPINFFETTVQTWIFRPQFLSYLFSELGSENILEIIPKDNVFCTRVVFENLEFAIDNSDGPLTLIRMLQEMTEWQKNMECRNIKLMLKKIFQWKWKKMICIIPELREEIIVTAYTAWIQQEFRNFSDPESYFIDILDYIYQQRYIHFCLAEEPYEEKTDWHKLISSKLQNIFEICSYHNMEEVIFLLEKFNISDKEILNSLYHVLEKDACCWLLFLFDAFNSQNMDALNWFLRIQPAFDIFLDRDKVITLAKDYGINAIPTMLNSIYETLGFQNTFEKNV